MASLARRRNEGTAHIWPGFVDALATLLMVIIFLLLIFVMAQFFLGHALVGRDEALRKLQGEMGELANMLALERKKSGDLSASVARLTTELQASLEAKAKMGASLAEMRLRAETAEQQLVDAMVSMEANRQNIDKMQKSLAANDKELAEKSEKLARLSRDVEALTALRDELLKKVEDLGAQLNEKGKALVTEKELSESARAQVALLNQQMAALRQQLASLQAALDASEAESKAQKVQIETLGNRLNAALASKVQELSRYRSEFFGRLREVLGNRPGIRIVGDRFVFQSEVLFDVGSADLGAAGKEQMQSLAKTLLELSKRIPDDIDWVLRVDGHTDKTPISTARFPSNWELSTARAISVVKYLIEQGLPPIRLVAAGFADNRPIDTGNSDEALRRNRRIELKLTER